MSCKNFLLAPVVVATLGFSGVSAADEAGSANSHAFGIDFQSHFVSYGADVWGAGEDLFGNEHTTFVYMTNEIALSDSLSFNFGAWADVNDNAPEDAASVGGHIQEVDVYGGFGYSAGVFSLSLTYQEWNYGGGTAERIVDVGIGIDDSSALGAFSLNPSLTAHSRVGSDAGAEEGTVFVLAIGPGFSAGPLSVSIPVAVGFVPDEYYDPASDSGTYFSYGLTGSVPMSFIPAKYGDWSFSAGVIAYSTDADSIPGNVEEDFTTAYTSIGLGF